MSKLLLSQSLEAYKKADNYQQSSKLIDEPKIIDNGDNDPTVITISSESSDSNNKKESNSTASAKENIEQDQEEEGEEVDKEDWLHYYMFGKISEKQHGSLIDIIRYYMKVII